MQQDSEQPSSAATGTGEPPGLAAFRAGFTRRDRALQRLGSSIGMVRGLFRAFWKDPSSGARLLSEVLATHRTGLFDRDYYCWAHPRVSSVHFASPLLDYCLEGWRAGRVADRFLDVAAAAGGNVVGDASPDPPAANPLVAHAKRFGSGVRPSTASAIELRSVLHPIRSRSEARAASVRRARAQAAPKPPLAVVVPVYNHPELLPPLVASLLEHTPPDVLLMFVENGSGDPRVRPALLRLEAAYPGRVRVECLDANAGFAGACNHGIRAAGRRDVILLNNDTVVSPRWSDALRLAAYGDDRVGSATAVSNNSGAVSVPETGFNEMPAGLTVAQVARGWLHGPDLVFDWHTGHGFCLYLKRAMLDDVGLFDEETFGKGYGEENDLCLRANRRGWAHRIVPRAFVWHLNAASFGSAEKSERVRKAGEVLRARYPELDFLQSSGFRGWEAARPVFRFLASSMACGPRPRPRVLFVLGGVLDGGTFHTTADLARAIGGSFESFLLVCEGRRMKLFDTSRPGSAPVREHALSDFVPLGTHALAEHDDTLVDWVLDLGVEIVHVRHLLRGSAGFLPRLRALHVPVVFSFHDYYAACPALKLLDSRRRFHPDGVEDGETKFVDWTPLRPDGPVLDKESAHRWKARFAERIVPCCDAFVTTSPDAKSRLENLIPVLRERDADFHVIPHGRDFPAFETLAVPPSPGEPVRVLVPGAFTPDKGSDIIATVAERDGGRTVVFHVLGATHKRVEDLARPGLVFHGPYARDDFSARVREIRPSFAAILSPWPETWCHTLTESWAAGIPVFAFDLGAPGERLRTECPGGGWILPPDSPADAMLAAIREAAGDPAAFERATEAVRAWQNGIGATNTVHRMAARYADIYCSLLDHSRSGAAPDAPAPFPADKTRDATPADPASLDRTDLSCAGTLRLSGFPLARPDEARIQLLARLCGARLALDETTAGNAVWRTNGVLHHAFLAAADEVAKANRPPLAPDGMPEIRVASHVSVPGWLRDARLRTWREAAATRRAPARHVVYTAIAGGYETLKIPEAPDPDVEYVYFASEPAKDEGPWELRPFARTDEDPTRTARWHKLHGPELFPDAETVVWIDGNLTLLAGVEREIREKLLASPHPIATLRHFDRSSVFEEAEACIERGKDAPALVRAQVARYRAAGLPQEHPFAETCIVAFRPGDPRARAVFATWWEELSAGSRRDQLSLPFALWKNGAGFTPLFDRDIRLAADKVRFADHARHAPSAPCVHARQFVLSRRRFDGHGFRHLELPDGFVLSYHPELRVRATPDRRNVLVGLAWSCDGAAPDPLAAAAACPDDESLERVLDSWSGRWILLRDGRLRMDACGLLGVFFRGGDCSSSLALLCEHLGIRPRRPGLKHQFGGMDFYPGPLSPAPGVNRLLPSQSLDLAAGAAFERPPEPPAPAFASEDDRVAAVVEAFDVLLRRIAADYPGRVQLPLTAGYDSRTLAALLEHAGAGYKTFTMDHRRLRAGDRDIPPRLAAAVGREHRFVPRPARPVPGRFRAYDEHCAGLAVDEDRNFYAFRQYPEPAEPACRVAVLRGGVWEAVREYYRAKHRLFRTAQDLSEFTGAFLNVRFRPDLQRAFAAWLDHCRAVPDALDPVDRYYLEQRAGAWLSSVEQSLDIVPGMDSIQPCNCRRIISILRSFPREDRIACRHEVAIVRAACPALLSVPFQGSGAFVHGNPNSQPATLRALLARKRETLRTYLRCLGLHGTIRLLLDERVRK